MKTMIARLVATVAVLSAVSACGSQPLLNNRPASLNRFAAPSGPVRSNAGLDTIAKRMRTILYNQADANHDGVVHRHEVTFIPAELYTAADKNRDGMWQLNEFQAFDFSQTSVQVPSRDLLRAMAQQAWTAVNKDSNAFVTLDEMIAAMTHTVPTTPPPCMDPAKCPTQTPANPLNPQQVIQEATSVFNSHDKNFDRKLNFSEFEDMQAGYMLSGMEAPRPHTPPPPPCNGDCPAPRR
ncbi:MAG TPA: hypothetical protein V6D23_17990 [Candidatus Obscuribacterales bacterium]